MTLSDFSLPLSPIIIKYMGGGYPIRKEWRKRKGTFLRREATRCFRWPNSQVSSWPQEVALEGGIGSSLA